MTARQSSHPRECDSDTDSFLSDLDPFSPTNGYFSQREHPQDMYINTSSSSSDSAATSKAREAASESQTARTPTSAYTPRTPARPFSGETTPLLQSFQPPPAYGDLYNGRPSDVANEESARLLTFDGHGAPQPMSNPELYEDLYPQRRKRLRDCCSRRRMIKAAIAVLLVSLTVWIVSAATRPQREEKETIPLPAEPEVPQKGRQGFPIRWPAHCDKDPQTRSQEIDFGSPNELRIEEVVPSNRNFRRISGWIHVVKAPEGQSSDVKAKLSYAVSRSVDIADMHYTKTSTGLIVTGPSITKGTKASCLGISIVLYLKPGTTFENLALTAKHLGTQFHEGVDFSVTNSTSVSMISGTFDSPPFNSRETRIETISGSITGKYTLMDLLSIKSKSGSVNVNVEPKEADEKNVKPAIFRTGSVSGSVRIDFEMADIPARDYQTSVETEVGSLEGSFIHGSYTSLLSSAGSITADIQPYSASKGPSRLDTNSNSGKTDITLRSPYKNPGTAMGSLYSSHKGVSGAIQLSYPQEWEGTLEGSSATGSLHLEGRDLELLEGGQENTVFGRRVLAKKGKGSSRLDFSTVSGSIKARVGDV